MRERVVRLIRHRALGPAAGAPGRLVVISIDGRSGSGKSTLAAEVASALPSAALIALEDVYPGWDGLAAAPELLRRSVLVPLLAGRAAGYHRFDWNCGCVGEEVAIGRPRMLIIEGVGALDPRLAVPPAAGHRLGVWVHAPAAVRYRRAMARDGALYRPHWDRWAAQERRYLHRVRPVRRADLLIRTAAEPDG